MIVQATANFEVNMEGAEAAAEAVAPVAEGGETVKLFLDEVGVALCEAVQKVYDAAETKDEDLLVKFVFTGIDICMQLHGPDAAKELCLQMADMLGKMKEPTLH